jgi:YcxB-like protein
MTISFTYDKRQVMQALRYHFISRPEIRIMLILVNVFALVCAILYYFKKITPLAVLTGSLIWFFLMINFWFVMPALVYKRAATFKDHFTMQFEEDGFSLGNERGSRAWPWKALSTFMESPNFFHLYFDSRSFFLIPKNSFGSRDEIFELRQLLKAKVKK